MVPCLRFGLRSFAAGLSFLALGCAETNGPRTWVGRASASEEVIALVEQDDAVLAYVCGGATTFQTHSRWFAGTADDAGAVEIARDGWALSASVNDGATRADLLGPGGEEVTFDLRPAAGEDEGLYAAMDSGCRTGVVLTTDLEGETLLQGTWCDSKNNAAQVTPVLPVEVQDDRLHVQVDLSFLGEGSRDLFVLRVREP